MANQLIAQCETGINAVSAVALGEMSAECSCHRGRLLTQPLDFTDDRRSYPNLIVKGDAMNLRLG